MKVKDPGVKVSIHDLVKPLTLDSIAGNYYRRVLINKLSRRILSHLVYVSLGVLVKHYNDEYEKYGERAVLSTFGESSSSYIKNCVTRRDNNLKKAEDIKNIRTLFKSTTGVRDDTVR
ncbi:MAG: hypothetical protein GY920_11445 [Aliivibrio sp.]|nr:hypothetical protein [Aliivibrio sp.]